MSGQTDIKNILRFAQIPYDRKQALSRQLEGDIEGLVQAMQKRGKSEAQIKQAIDDFLLANNEVGEQIENGFNTKIFLQLKKMPVGVRSFIEQSAGIVPITLTTYFIMMEVPMIRFLQEGGVGMIAILLFGAVLVYQQLALFFRTIVVKDHSKKNMNVDSFSVLIGVLALVLLGIGVTCLGAYVTVTGVVAHKMPSTVMTLGLKESITALIVSASLAALVLLIHFTTRRLLVSWQAPDF